MTVKKRFNSFFQLIQPCLALRPLQESSPQQPKARAVLAVLWLDEVPVYKNKTYLIIAGVVLFTGTVWYFFGGNIIDFFKGSGPDLGGTDDIKTRRSALLASRRGYTFKKQSTQQPEATNIELANSQGLDIKLYPTSKSTGSITPCLWRGKKNKY